VGTLPDSGWCRAVQVSGFKRCALLSFRLTMRRTPLPIGAMSGGLAPAEPYTTENQNGDTVIAEGSSTFI